MDLNPSSPTTISSAAAAAATSTTTTSSATATTSNAQIQSSLKSLNKSSYKISKPTNRPSPPPPLPISTPSEPTTAATSTPDPNPSSISASTLSGPAAPPQPPVYNIDKNNFREIVQKLTGSVSPIPPRPTAPPTVSTPPIPPPPQPQPSNSSRLHRIRPPPLANLSARPPSITAQQVLSPLPPLPSVGVTAESPISAYMRRLHSTGMEPLSPLGFGCLQSPRTAYQMMMMSSAGLPTSPGVPPLPAPSPRGER